MSLPWFRVDTDIASHDKILALVSEKHPQGLQWQAAFSYVSAIGWSVAHQTDGRIPQMALPFVHGTVKTARLLVIDRGFGPLWLEGPSGWQVVNFGDRQQTAAVTEAKHEATRTASEKGNCVRWHPKDCWQTGRGCSRASA